MHLCGVEEAKDQWDWMVAARIEPSVLSPFLTLSSFVLLSFERFLWRVATFFRVFTPPSGVGLAASLDGFFLFQVSHISEVKMGVPRREEKERKREEETVPLRCGSSGDGADKAQCVAYSHDRRRTTLYACLS